MTGATFQTDHGPANNRPHRCPDPIAALENGGQKYPAVMRHAMAAPVAGQAMAAAPVGVPWR